MSSPSILAWLPLSGMFYTLYALFCVLFSAVLAYSLPRRLRKTRVLNFMLLLLLMLSQVLSGVGLALLLFALLHTKTFFKRRIKSFFSLLLPEYQRAPQHQTLTFGEGSAASVLKRSELSKDVREQMLVAINRFHNASVNQMNKLLLSDDVDEVRLYAQGLLEKQERALFRLIRQLSRLLHQSRQTATQAFFEKHIAELLWEQIYKGLVDSESIHASFTKIKDFAEHALLTLTRDAALPLLLAMVALKQNALDEAKRWLDMARKNHAPSYRIVLFEAEIAFKEKRYADAKTLLQHVAHTPILGAQSLIHFWNAL